VRPSRRAACPAVQRSTVCETLRIQGSKKDRNESSGRTAETRLRHGGENVDSASVACVLVPS
jgi:hypothetical protein